MRKYFKTRLVHGYTLIELLVTVGIILSLFALIFAAMAPSRERARETSCLSNVRQISLAMSMYISDYDGYYPPAVAGNFADVGEAIHAPIWYDLLPISPQSNSHGNSHLFCPDRELPGAFAKLNYPSLLSGYAYNTLLTSLAHQEGRTFTRLGQSESILAYPATTITVAEARTGVISMATPDTQIIWESTGAITLVEYVNEIKQQSPGAKRHSGGANYLFADGHTKWLPPDAIKWKRYSDGSAPNFVP